MEVYGIDLSPLFFRHGELLAAIEAGEAEEQRRGELRRDISRTRMKIIQITATAQAEGYPGADWQAVEDRAYAAPAAARQITDIPALEDCWAGIELLHEQAHEVFLEVTAPAAICAK